MSRKLGRIGVMTAAALAIVAVTASAAQAKPKYTSAAYPNTMRSEQPGHRFTAGGQTVECTATFEGTLFAASESFTVTPSYKGCKGLLGLPVDVVTNGCDYLFTAPVEVKANQFQVPTDISCGAGKAIELKATLSGMVVCTVTIFPQGPLNGVQMTNETETGDLVIENGFGGVFYEELGAACPGEPGVLQNNGAYDVGTNTLTSKTATNFDIG